MNPTQHSDIVRRLNCAAGHLKAVIKMVEDGKTCEQVVHQIAAVDAALRVVGTRLIIDQAQLSQSILLDSSSIQQRSDELKRLQSLYTILLRNSDYYSEVSYE